MSKMKDGIAVRGFFRVQITDDDGVVGDSGWVENTITNEGFRQYLCLVLGGISGSAQVAYAALGEGTAPGASDTSLQSEVEKRAAVTAATSSTSKAVRFTATFASSDSFVTNTKTLQNIGLFASSSGGTIFAGNTFATSTCATNQNCNVTYDISFT